MALFARAVNIGEQPVTLRLSARKLQEYLDKHGVDGAPAYVGVMQAVDDLGAKIDLFSAALSYTGANNFVRSGSDLIDMMADAGWTMDQVSDLIVGLAVDAGILPGDKLEEFQTAIRTTSRNGIDKILAVLNGRPENPTE